MTTLYVPTISVAPQLSVAPQISKPVQPPVFPVQGELSDPERRLWTFFLENELQRRKDAGLHPTLIEFARDRTRYIVNNRLPQHETENGIGPNHMLWSYGYALPVWYSKNLDANSIESLAYGVTGVAQAWELWMESPPHRQHLLGNHTMYEEQTCVGVGATAQGNSWCFVVITAPPYS